MIPMLLVFLSGIEVATSYEVEKTERDKFSTWYLGMNLNPADGHVMDFTTGWADNAFIGTYADALKKDYLNRIVWGHPVTYIALVRHQAGEVDAVKVFRFKDSGKSLLSMFQAMNPGRQVVTEGGPIHESVSKNAQNLVDDPIFSVGGDLAFNWAYGNNGARIVLTGGHLSAADQNDDNTHGLGNHFACNPLTGIAIPGYEKKWNHEISNIQNSPLSGTPPIEVQVQGTDYGTGGHYRSTPVYGNYAIYVSEDATSFLEPGQKLDIEVNVVPKYRYLI